MSYRHVYNYPLPDDYYNINDPRSTPMASQRSTGSESSNWSNTTTESFQSSTTRRPSQCPSAHNTSRSHNTSSANRVLSSPDERSERESREFCPHADCTDAHGHPNRAFTRKADVQRHYNSTHQKKLMDCPKPRCTRKGEGGFTRQDHLVEHLRGYHREDIAKRQSSTASSRSGGSPQY